MVQLYQTDFGVELRKKYGISFRNSETTNGSNEERYTRSERDFQYFFCDHLLLLLLCHCPTTINKCVCISSYLAQTRKEIQKRQTPQVHGYQTRGMQPPSHIHFTNAAPNVPSIKTPLPNAMPSWSNSCPTHYKAALAFEPSGSGEEKEN